MARSLRLDPASAEPRRVRSRASRGPSAPSQDDVTQHQMIRRQAEMVSCVL